MYLGITCFYHENEENGCFSNWYKAEFTYARRRFSSVEQYMMYHKALMFREYDLAKRIMNTEDTAKIKRLGRSKMEHFDADLWDRTSKQIVKRGVRAKFEQNEELRRKLLQTGFSAIAECSRNDKKWGIGVAITDEKRYDISKWRGQNLLGQILMEVRDELRSAAYKESLGYVDAHDLDFELWNTKPGELKQLPMFRDAIHAYADTLIGDYERGCFYSVPFKEWDIAMHENMGGGLPAIGFWEMKQDIYDTVRYRG